MITEKAKEKVALFIKEFFQTANVGTGGDSTNPDSNVLDVPILAANKATTNYVSDRTTIDFSLSFTGSEVLGHSIREFGIFSATTPTDDNFDELRTTTSYSAESTMLSRVNFDGVGPFSNSDQIDITFIVEVE
jgi:hypothetical protein|tara:strand:- start:577 stop:975 length:399 start_codon:yes stop_codon:yes gene_type:complete